VAWAGSEPSNETDKHFSRSDKFYYLNKGVYSYQEKKGTLSVTGNAAMKVIASFMKKEKASLKMPLNFNPDILTKNFNYAYTLSNAQLSSPNLSKSCYPQIIEFPAKRTDKIYISLIYYGILDNTNLYPPSCKKAAEYILCRAALKNDYFEFISPNQYDLLMKNSEFIDKFHEMTWSMSIDDVMQKEKLLMYRISNGIYRSNRVKMNGFETLLQYRFKNGKLCSGSYIIPVKPHKIHSNKLYFSTIYFGTFYNDLSEKYGYPTRKSLLLWKDKPCNDMSKWDNMFDNSELKLRDEWKLKNVHVSITLQKKQSEAELIIEYSSPEFASLSQILPI
jgi:hypothetical protein